HELVDFYMAGRNGLCHRLTRPCPKRVSPVPRNISPHHSYLDCWDTTLAEARSSVSNATIVPQFSAPTIDITIRIDFNPAETYDSTWIDGVSENSSNESSEFVPFISFD